MRTLIGKWGNSAAVRLPKTVLDELGLALGQELEIDIVKRSLRLSPVGTGVPNLDDLVAEMKRLGGEDYDYGQEEWPLLPNEIEP